MYVCTALLYFYILIYSASNGCKCVSINSVQFMTNADMIPSFSRLTTYKPWNCCCTQGTEQEIRLSKANIAMNNYHHHRRWAPLNVCGDLMLLGSVMCNVTSYVSNGSDISCR